VVSIVFVVDGLFSPPVDLLRQAFTFARPFKTHYLVDQSAEKYWPCKHHRYEIRRAAQRGVEVRIVPLLDILDAWTALYDGLIVHRNIEGVQRFSRESFEVLDQCEGISTVAAFIGRDLVSCHLWVRYGDIVWSHLAASNERGYASRAAYAVYDESIRHFSGCLINLGGAVGTSDVADEGLARFKAGFSNRSNIAHLVGAVLDPGTYQNLCTEHGNASVGDYFPSYRAPSVRRANSPFQIAFDDS
jgi:hypothetical protein